MHSSLSIPLFFLPYILFNICTAGLDNLDRYKASVDHSENLDINARIREISSEMNTKVQRHTDAAGTDTDARNTKSETVLLFIKDLEVVLTRLCIIKASLERQRGAVMRMDGEIMAARAKSTPISTEDAAELANMRSEFQRFRAKMREKKKKLEYTYRDQLVKNPAQKNVVYQFRGEAESFLKKEEERREAVINDMERRVRDAQDAAERGLEEERAVIGDVQRCLLAGLSKTIGDVEETFRKCLDVKEYVLGLWGGEV